MRHQHESVSMRLHAFVGRLLSTVPPKRRDQRLVVAAVQHRAHRHLNTRTPSGAQPVVAVDPAATRKAEIERLLAQSATPSTALSFLRGLSALSAPTPAT